MRSVDKLRPTKKMTTPSLEVIVWKDGERTAHAEDAVSVEQDSQKLVIYNRNKPDWEFKDKRYDGLSVMPTEGKIEHE